MHKLPTSASHLKDRAEYSAGQVTTNTLDQLDSEHRVSVTVHTVQQVLAVLLLLALCPHILGELAWEFPYRS